MLRSRNLILKKTGFCVVFIKPFLYTFTPMNQPLTMKKSFLSLFLVLLSTILLSQNKPVYQSADLAGFDRAAAWKQAQLKSAKPAEQKEYFESLIRTHIRKTKQQNPVISSTKPFTIGNSANKTIINLSPYNSYCPNADFGNANFSNWQGGTYSNTAGVNWNTFTPAWVNGIMTMGNNNPNQAAVSWAAGTPKQNRHTIMTIPPTVNNPPANCIGWDSMAVGMSHLSEIPFVPPTGGGVTCRLGNANPDYETENLIYTMNVSLANSQFTYAYAVVLYDGGHLVGEQPFFKVTMRDQNGNLIAGCGSYQVDASTVATDTSFHRASQWDSFSNGWIDGYTTGTTPNPSWYMDVYYKKWTTVGVDLTGYIGQNVTVEFQTADCIYGGHWGYAYIDANCGPTQALVNMCSGNTTQQILGPSGYISYQWAGPNNQASTIAAPAGTNDTLFISNGQPGDTYYLTAVSANGCTTYVQAILQYSSVSVVYTNSTPSCPGGNSGTAQAVATGSPGPYQYAWTNSSGQNVGNTNPATGLSPGTYSVHISALNCGSYDTVVTVGIAPPITTTTTKNFCGTAAYLVVPTPGATNIQWYDASGNAVPGTAGSNDTLLATNASNGQTYAVVYTASGCIDSLRISLTQVSGGSLTHSNIQNICVGATNGQAVVNLSTTAPAPYNYSMTGPNYNQVYNGVSQTSYTLTGLSYGNYTVTAFDGTCFYGDVFKIDTIPVPVWLTIAPKALCSNDSAFINYTFGGAPPTQCQLSSSSCVSATTHLVGPANASNSSFSYPTPFGNFYTKMRAQYIYTAAELSAAGLSAGKLNSIAFNCTQINGATAYPNFNISIGCTSQSTYNSFPAPTDLIPGLFNVFTSPSYNVVLGQNNFSFSQPYEWDGVSNVVVEVCFEFPGTYNYISNCVVDNTTSSVYPSLTVKSDTDPMCAGLTSTGFYYAQADQMRPVATFGWCSSVAVPSMYSYSLNPNTGLLNAPLNPPTTSIIQPATTTSYTFTTTSLTGGCTKKDTFTISIVKPFNIHVPTPVSFCTNNVPVNLLATFTDASTGAPITIQATWAGAGVSANNGTGTATFNPATAGVGSHTLIVTAGGQCMMKDSVVYTVNTWQSAQQIFSDSLFCIYDAPYQIQGVNPGGVWSGPVSATGLFTPSVAGISSPYHYIKYVTNGGSPCPDSTTIRVQVFGQPVIDFLTDTTEGCAPNVNISFTSSVTPTGGTYNWSFGNGQTSTNANPQNLYTIAGTYSPKLIYTDLNGCSDTLTKTGLIIVHVWQSAHISISDSVLCVSDPPIMIQSTTPGGTWTGPVSGAGLLNPSTAGVTANLTPPYHTIKYVVNGGTACADSAFIHVSVLNKPLVNFTTDTTEGCAPNTGIAFTSNVSPLGGTYHWVFGDGQTSSAQDPQNVYILPGTYSPKLTYTDLNGCHDSLTKTALVIVHPAPVASFYANPSHTTILEPHIYFVNTSTGPNNIKWLWNIANLSSATTKNTDYEFADAGSYQISLLVINSFGCRDSITEIVVIDPDNVLYVPSAFTPNFDGKNDVLMAEAFGVFNTDGFRMQIYDRWGNKLFESHDIYKGWDGMKAGQVLQEDTYIYSIDYKDNTKKLHTKTGQVSLIK